MTSDGYPKDAPMTELVPNPENPCEDALVEGFITGSIAGRNGERTRLYERLVAYQGGYIESDMVVIPTTIPIATVFEWLRG